MTEPALTPADSLGVAGALRAALVDLSADPVQRAGALLWLAERAGAPFPDLRRAGSAHPLLSGAPAAVRAALDVVERHVETALQGRTRQDRTLQDRTRPGPHTTSQTAP